MDGHVLFVPVFSQSGLTLDLDLFLSRESQPPILPMGGSGRLAVTLARSDRRSCHMGAD